MATTTTTEQRLGRVHEDDERPQDGGDRGVVAREAASRRVSLLAVEGGDADSSKGAGRSQLGVSIGRPGRLLQEDAVAARRRRSFGGARAPLPPPHSWLAIEDTSGKKQQYHSDPEAAAEEEQWAWLLGATGARQQQQQLRRSSFTVVRRERAAREAWLDRAWEMKRSWHERNGGAPDADTPVVVVVGKGGGGGEGGEGASSPGGSHQQAGAAGGGGVAMDVDEVRACRDLGLELPSDCTVEIQCYGLTSGGSSPTHNASSGGADSPGAVSSPGADPMDVKARLKVWAQAVALASTTHLSS